MAIPSDLDRVRSAIEALNAGTILYSEFDAIVVSVVAGGKMTREDVRHELEAALVEDKVRRDPPELPAVESRVPPKIASRNSRARRSTPPGARRRRGRSPLGWFLIGIASIVGLGVLAWLILPDLDLGDFSKKVSALRAGDLPVVPLPIDSTSVPADPSEPTSAVAAAAAPSIPAPAPTPAPATVAASNPETVQPSPMVHSAPDAQVDSAPPPTAAAVSSVAPTQAPARIVPPIKLASAASRPESPGSPPVNAQATPRLRFAPGYDSFADECPYPRKALAHGDTGKVGLFAYVATDGSVLNTAIDSSSGSLDLDQAAAVCVQEKARFQPKTEDGGKVGYWGRITFNWTFGTE